ncbi:hypothetical protein [Phenylobacterium montanum]|uniref:Uncharacterized protein n=1 Tax=Phenylobacterium montanum TaxID=2823693 RepID=A0A975FW32_9CAUL|nr:hypothetical protein [Caulobacter sp. S6]QUD86365.1 hypothetical protein KCG34_14800 [Caulobacter sp. S6]
MSTSSPQVQVEPAPQEARVDRIASAAALDMLERLKDPALLASGAVNLIALDAIQAKLGDRWETKRGRVWEHVEREIERTIGPANLSVRLDDTHYLIALPSSPGLAAQATCLTVLQDVLKFFLGELRPADMAVRNISAIEGAEIISAPVDLHRLHAAASAPQAPAAASTARQGAGAPSPSAPSTAIMLGEEAPAAPDWRPPLAGRSFRERVEPPKRPPFELTVSDEPVWNLRQGIITSFVIDRAGAPAGADAPVQEEIDMAVFRHAADLLREHASQGGPFVLHVPVHFMSLATQRTRLRLLGVTQPVREAMRQMVLLEICGLDPGVPPSRLIEVIGLVRSLCGGVLGRVRPSKPALAAVRGCGLKGLVIEAPLLAPQGPEGEARLKVFAGAAHGLSPNLIIHGLPTPNLIDVAASAGFTHASAAPLPGK